MQKVGLVGWRGMVGSVLIGRMLDERDFDLIDPVFFSTSQVGGKGPDIGRATASLADARSIEALRGMDIVISCQGGDYTNEIHPKLRAVGWGGYWIDAASALRMNDDAVIILDPVNRAAIDAAVKRGLKDYIGGNCTVSLMLLAMHGLFKADLVEWMTAMTYQAASGAGAENMRELVAQMGAAHAGVRGLLDDPAKGILEIDKAMADTLRSSAFPTRHFGAPLAGSLLPWIDKDLGNGQSKEEWKGGAEGNKILGRGTKPVPIDGVCVRVGAMRCHSQALTVKLRKDLPMEEIEVLLAQANDWVEVIPNRREQSLTALTPAVVTGGLKVPIGRLRKLSLEAGACHLTAFTVGDQLLWGAAEPLRRMLRILLGKL
ncbi:MAG: aspartate-semialdehyde dehydrogenase [Burkholderiales bacterium]